MPADLSSSARGCAEHAFPFLECELYFAGSGLAVEAGLYAMCLIMSGVFDQFPG